MRDHKALFTLEQMAQILGVSRSGYYDFLKRKPSKRELENEEIVRKIRTIFKESHETYGSPRIHAELCKQGSLCSRNKVARLMKGEDIQAKMYRKFVKTTKRSKKASRPTQDLVQQNFHIDLPNKIWVADITFIAVNKTWAYLAIILDLFSRRVVRMALSYHMRSSLILGALNQALLLRKPPSGLIHHSDLGNQYTSNDFHEVAKAHGIKLSHGNKSSAYDMQQWRVSFIRLKQNMSILKTTRLWKKQK